MATADVIVIGVGSMGAAVCAELARRGVKVMGIDRFTPPHAMGEHHGRTRLFRKAYYEHPDYVPLLNRAEELWRELQDEIRLTGIDVELFTVTGGLYMGRAGGELVKGSLASAKAHKLPLEPLQAAELRKRFPQFAFPMAPGDDWAAVYDPDGAVIACEQAVGAYVQRATAAGAKLLTGAVVTDLRQQGDHVAVSTTHGEHQAGTAVVTAGPWTAGLLPGLASRLTVTRQPVGFVLPKSNKPFVVGKFPAWAHENADGSLYYGTPLLSCQIGLKVARHAKGALADPDDVDRGAAGADTDDWRPALGLIPSAGANVIGTQICLYTNSPDGHFIVDRAPGMDRVLVACGFSGHGFKFVPVVGEVLADLATDGRTGLRTGFLGLGRFGEG